MIKKQKGVTLREAVIAVVILITMLFAGPVMAQDVIMTSKGVFITPGAVIYYYSNQIIQNSQTVVPTPITVTSDMTVVEVISENKTLGMVQVSVKLNNESLPVLVWTRIVDLKYR